MCESRPLSDTPRFAFTTEGFRYRLRLSLGLALGDAPWFASTAEGLRYRLGHAFGDAPWFSTAAEGGGHGHGGESSDDEELHSWILCGCLG
jgi:hypothetical protein